MTKEDMQRIFGVLDEIKVGLAVISVDDFLNKQGFKGCEPTKESMLAHDAGKKGYADFINSGNFS